jgi:tetratricopeptide (TPR) repeat protein
MPRLLRLAAAVASLALLSGCGGDSPSLSAEIDDSNYRIGQQFEKEGRWEEALAAYLRVINKRGDAAPESHLDAGLIYLNHLQNPVFAIYHLSRYLQMEPNSKNAVNVKGMIESAKREFARTLPGQPLEAASEHMGLEEQVVRLQRENDELRAEMAALRSGVTVPVTHTSTIDLSAIPKTEPVAAETTDTAPAPQTAISLAPDSGSSAISAAPEAAPAEQPAKPEAAGRHHVVVRGDTLFNLSVKYYGSRTRWREIYAANKSLLQSESTPLKIGMDLRIP